MNTKAVLRTEYQKRRDSLTEEQIADCSIQISNLSLTLNIWEYSIYHLFMTNEKNKEIDTSYLLSVIQGKDKQPVIPKIVDDNRLEHFLLNDQTPLKNNRWGIPEPLGGITINPKQIEVVFVPLLVFDQQVGPLRSNTLETTLCLEKLARGSTKPWEVSNLIPNDLVLKIFCWSLTL